MSDPVADLLANGGAKKSHPVFSDELGEFPHPDQFPAGKIGIVAGEQSRYTMFTQSAMMAMVTMPNNSGVMITNGVNVCGNCNTIVRSLKDHEKWVWLLGDDHTWARGTLPRLLKHLADGADVVVPHCLKRIPPWAAVVYSHQNEDGWWVAADLPKEGLTEIAAAGSAGMLIKREVLEAIGDPYFKPGPEAEGLNEDLYFCVKARELGFKVYCDPTIPFVHIGTHQLMPVWSEEGWDVKVSFGDETNFVTPGLHKRMRELGLKESEVAA